MQANPEKTAARTKHMRSSIDRDVQRAAVSASTKGMWARLDADPEAKAEFLRKRSETRKANGTNGKGAKSFWAALEEDPVRKAEFLVMRKLKIQEHHAARKAAKAA